MSVHTNSKLYRRFDGFRNTSFLWEGLLNDLQIFEKAELAISEHPQVNASPTIRLGKLVEEFVLFEMAQDESIKILQSNIQVFRERITIGELDCLINKSSANTHLEIVYKFYLYDPSFTEELDRWIGPNRKDSLVLKLRKLKEKQLPLLHQPETIKILDHLHIDSSQCIQQVYFKAQLFVPYQAITSTYPLVNKDCIKGFYIRQSELRLFEELVFYIPAKLDWLAEPYTDVEWLSAKYCFSDSF